MSFECASETVRSLLLETKDGEWGKEESFEQSTEMVVIRGTDFDAVRAGTLIGAPRRFIARKNADRKTLQPFDILIETAGGSKGRPTGKTVLLRPKIFESSPLPITCASFARFLRIDSSRADPEYVYWYLQHLYRNGVIESHQVQHTGIARFQFTKFAESTEVSIPPLGYQKKITEILGALDERIALLRETNATLEAIAQALFKSWFVDFDPVRAKIEGRIPQDMDEATAALFPNGLEERLSREVPHGWRIEKFGVMCSYLNRGLSPKYVDKGGVLVLNQKCVRDFAVDFNKGRRHDPAQRRIDGRELIVGDVLVNSTGVGTLGRVAQLLQIPERCIADSHVTVVRAGPLLTWPYLGQLLKQMQPEIEAMGEGSTGQTELSRSKLGDLPILVPSPEVLARFDAAVLPLKQRVSIQTQQAQTLATLRDTLLPRLISGQLRLPGIRRAAAEAVAV